MTSGSDIIVRWPDNNNNIPPPKARYGIWHENEDGLTIDFGIKKVPLEPKDIGITSDAFADVRRQMAELMAKDLDRLFCGGIEKEKKMPKNDERTVYNIFVVDPEDDGKVIAKLENVIAKNAEAAKLKAVLQLAENEDKLRKDLEDYDFLVEDVADFGSIRPK